MFRVSRTTDYALNVMHHMAQAGNCVVSSTDLAERTGISEPNVAKVLKLLTRAGFVSSIRGVAGGYKLSKKLSDINMADFIAAMEGPIAVTSCMDKTKANCNLHDICVGRSKWGMVNNVIAQALQGITLQQTVLK